MTAIETKNWLNNRFKKNDPYGVYLAHEPIYGFRKGHCETSIIFRYILTYQIVKHLTRVKYSSFLDVGGAEGYKAFIARFFFAVDVNSCDISSEACKRANEIFQIDGEAVDIHNLPFKSDNFDVVLCSETLEHVADYNVAINELLRVSRGAVLITVPHESKAEVEKNIRSKVIHGHINQFSINSFDYLSKNGYTVYSSKLVSPLLSVPSLLVEASPIVHSRIPKTIVGVYNSSLPVLRRLFGRNVAAFMLIIDELICHYIPIYRSIIVLIVKNKNVLLKKSQLKISPTQILSVAVLPYFLDLPSSS